jgi:hypothetical protein
MTVDPFADEMCGQPAVTTASASAYRAVDYQPRANRRPFSAMVVEGEGGAVTHGPLLFEDLWEEHERSDDRFAWTAEDYLAWFAGGARFLVNTALCPVSALVTPPWKAMVSDGVPGPRVFDLEMHDAARERRGLAPQMTAEDEMS